MNQKRIILRLLVSRKRVDITTKNYFSFIRGMSILLFLFIVLVNCTFLYFNEVNFLSVGISTGNLLLFGMIFRNILKNTSSTSIKGDTLILNSSNNKPCVTSLRSIKRIKSFTFFTIQITQLYYNLDGRDRKTFIFTRKNAYSYSPENLLRKAIKLSKKQKANHKPGPVTA